MDKSTRRGSALILPCMLAGATLLLAGLMMAHCIAIYRVGIAPENIAENGARIADIYSPAVIAHHARQLAWAFWLWLALLAAAIADRAFHPTAAHCLPGTKTVPKRLPEPFAAQDERAASITRCILLAAAIALLVLGMLNGGMHDVLVKAINICTECIGLG